MNPTAAAVITKNRAARRLRTLPRIKRRPPAPSFVLVSEAVADAAHGEQVLGRAGIALDFLAEVAYVNVDRPRVAIRRVPPHLLQKHLARLHAPGDRASAARISNSTYVSWTRFRRAVTTRRSKSIFRPPAVIGSSPPGRTPIISARRSAARILLRNSRTENGFVM